MYQTEAKTLPLATTIWLVFCALLAIGATILAAWQGKILGWPAFILLSGIAMVSVLAILIILLNRGGNEGQNTAGDDDLGVLHDIFLALPVPSLLVVNGRPERASHSYLELAQSLGVSGSLDEIPPIERVFARKDSTASSAMFKLHHTDQISCQNEDTIKILVEDNRYRMFKITVQALEDRQFWRIEEQFENDGAVASLLASAPVGLLSVTENGDIVEMNGVLCGWLGVNGTDEPKHLSDVIENPALLLEGPHQVGRIVRGDTRLLTHKGVVIPTVMTAVWKQMDSGQRYASIALYGHSGLGEGARKSTANRGQLATLSESDRADVFANAPFGVVWLDDTDIARAKIIGTNQKLLSMLGVAALDGQVFSSIFGGSKTKDDLLNSGFENHESARDIPLENERNSPVNIYFSKSDSFGLLAFIIDISTRKDLETQLAQSQKMQAIGQLAGGVAHDFNNLLTAIRLNTDELLGRHPIGDPSYPELQRINQTVSRASGLVRKLLAFSRKQTMRAEALNVTDTLSDMGILLKQVLGERVTLDTDHGRGLPLIEADKNQLETVLMNLCVNARDAMLDTGGGTITLRSSLPDVEALSADNIPHDDNQGYVLIEVKDTGTGMDEETQSKIFEPFFTTKEQGKGTGLGLATVYGIVQQLGAHLRLQSQLGVGTTFKLYMPVASKNLQKVAQDKPKPKPENVRPTDLAGTGEILFVEDEGAVRAIAAKTLRKRGYTVVEAEDGEEAFEILSERDKPFDLMVSDVVMPGMDGPALLRKAKTMLEDTEIVFISGYAREEFSDLLSENPEVTFLPKPFTLKQLAEKVKTVLSPSDA